MLSRRSVRVKVMQLLYAMSRDEQLAKEDVKKMYWKTIDNSYDVFLFNFYTFYQVAKIAADDEVHRKSKHLITKEDQLFTACIFENELLHSVRDNKSLQKIFEKKGFASFSDRDLYKNIYNEFSKDTAYIEYVIKENKTNEDHLEALLNLYRFCRKNEVFLEMMEDNYINWIDDKSLVVGAVKKILKALPRSDENLFKAFFPDDETVKEYGEELLLSTIRGDDVLLENISPLLQNWDQDRVAVVDLILLKMATSEFLNFPTIPTKVTLNEFVEVSKQYSTDKSKEFVNGVLDKLMKNLSVEGKLEKEGRGLVD